MLSNLAQDAWNFAATVVILAVFVALFSQAVYGIFLRYYVQRAATRLWLRRKSRLLRDSDFIRFAHEEERRERPWGIYDVKGKIRSTKKGFSGYISGLLFILKDVYSLWFLSRSIGVPKWDISWQLLEKEVFDLAGAGDRAKGLYSLSYEQLCGQIGSAVYAEVENRSSSYLLDIFIFPAVYRSLEYDETRQGLAHFAEKGIDDLQIYLAKIWNRTNYLFPFVVSIVLIGLFRASSLDPSPNQGGGSIFTSEFMLYGLIAFAITALAPVLRNLLDQLISLR